MREQKEAPAAPPEVRPRVWRLVEKRGQRSLAAVSGEAVESAAGVCFCLSALLDPVQLVSARKLSALRLLSEPLFAVADRNTSYLRRQGR